MKPAQVLVLSADLLISALLGALLDSEGYDPQFVREGESSRDALVRLRPAVVLVDTEDEALSTDAFLGPATMMRIKIIVFGGQRALARHDGMRERLGAGVLVLPVRPGQLSELIEAARHP